MLRARRGRDKVTAGRHDPLPSPARHVESHLAEGVRLAVEDLTAQASDLESDTVDLAAQLWAGFVARLLADDCRQDGQELAQRLIGYRRVSLALVSELARDRGVSRVELMRTLGPWLEMETTE